MQRHGANGAGSPQNGSCLLGCRGVCFGTAGGAPAGVKRGRQRVATCSGRARWLWIMGRGRWRSSECRKTDRWLAGLVRHGPPVRPVRPSSHSSQPPRPASQCATSVPSAPMPPVTTIEPPSEAAAAWEAAAGGPAVATGPGSRASRLGPSQALATRARPYISRPAASAAWLISASPGKRLQWHNQQRLQSFARPGQIGASQKQNGPCRAMPLPPHLVGSGG